MGGFGSGFRVSGELLRRNVQRFRGGLVFKAHRLCVSLNSRLESDEEEKKSYRPAGGGRVSGFGIRDSGFGLRDSGFGYRASNLGSRVSGSGFRDRTSIFGLRVSGIGYRVSGFGFRVSGVGRPSLGFRISGFGCRVSGIGFRVSGIGLRVSGSAPFHVSVLSPPVSPRRRDHPQHLPQIQRGHLFRVQWSGCAACMV